MKHAYHHNDLRNALIEEAFKVLSESGIAGLTLRELARRLGVTHTAPYAHFADKQELLAGVADVGFGLLADAVEAPRHPGFSAEDAFIAMAVAYVEFARANPDLYRLMFVAPDLVEDETCEMSEQGERAFQVLVKAIENLGPALPADPQDLAVGAWALVHGVAMLELDNRIKIKTAYSSTELATLATKVFLRGLREPHQSARYDTEKRPVEPDPPSL